MSKSKEHMRFEAGVIAIQLPDNRAEALLVLDYARNMVVESSDDLSGASDNVERVSGMNEAQPPAPSRVRGGIRVQ